MSEVLTNGIKVPDKGSRSWYDDMRGDLVKLDALIGSASSVTVNPMLTSGIEIASITVNGTSYSLYQQDGDIAVNIKPVTTNEELPILLSKSSEENTDTVDMSVGVTVNPSSNAITATTFVGDLIGNATSATSATKATQDASGNVINTTYATKADLSGKANNADVVHLANTEKITGIKYFTEDIYNKNENTVVTQTPTVNQYIRYRFIDNNNDLLASIQYANRANGTRDLALYLTTVDKSTLGVILNEDKSFYPLSNNDYSLGSSYYKWLNCYATNFYGNYGNFSNKVEAPIVRATADLGLVLANKDSKAPTTTSGWNQIQFYDKNMVQLGYFQLSSNTSANVYNWVGRKNADLTASRNIFWNVDEEVFGCSPSNTVSLGRSSNRWNNVYATTVNTSILDIPQNAIVLAFCSSAVNNGSTVAGTALKVANGGTGGAFTATTETLTGTYRALNTVVANGVGMFVKIA